MPRAHRNDRAALREGLIAAGFVMLCAIALFTVVLPELSDERSDMDETASTTADAGV